MSKPSVVISLDERRKLLEEESSAITDELMTSVGGKEPIGISTPLTDKEGFPRADIDIYRARNLRKRLNEIRYDHSTIMKKIEERIPISEKETNLRLKRKPKPKFDPQTGCFVVRNWDGSIAGIENGHIRSFDDIASEKKSHSGLENKNEFSDEKITDALKQQDRKPPFARIAVLLPNSPAKEAGLLEGDLVVSFGTIDYSNHRHLRAFGDVVLNAFQDGITVPMIVVRTKDDMERRISIKLKPRQWDGKGFVGCTFSLLINGLK